MPSSLQYPLERHRDLQRKWDRLLQRTVPPKDRVAADLRTPPRPDAVNRSRSSSQRAPASVRRGR